MGENKRRENGKVRLAISIIKQIQSEIKADFEPNLVYREYRPNVLGNKLRRYDEN